MNDYQAEFDNKMLLADLQVIIQVAEFRSITAAATSLDMSTATASAAVKRVEKSLGIELFIRTTRHLRLSSAGERYLPMCQEAMRTLALAEQNLKEELDVVEGEMRLTTSSDLGRNLVVNWLDEFMDEHPKIKIKAYISDTNVDFYRDPVDFALRYGAQTDANVYGFKICDVPRVLCAAPGYLSKHDELTHPEQLASHNGLFYQLQDIVHDVWLFSQDDNVFKIKMTGNRASNDGDLVRRWALAAKGIAVKSCLDIASDLLNNRLINVMPQFTPTPSELWLVCPSRQSITPALRLLREHFRTKCSNILQQLYSRKII
ncbi:LysR substrate-binding domain-containing protein [Rheinheimera baltica]|uniref:LysR substrate-binding domain-containing protein n=1 Tax=Rheinheimera baltica TaxID=67576 RepID=UPI00273D2BAF|nr:LysR substrate-binding domain-containing protein [Rheinheimera baltica]MDP5189533.1 LysR substrate-binding domain-containing protein [Rheinheimera baltica]